MFEIGTTLAISLSQGESSELQGENPPEPEDEAKHQGKQRGQTQPGSLVKSFQLLDEALSETRPS